MNTNHIVCPKCGTSIEITEALKAQIETELMSAVSEKHKKEIEEARKTASRDMQEKMKLLEEESARRKAALEEAQKAELELRKEKNKFEDEKRAFELEKQRQLDAERRTIREKTMAEASEQFRLKDKEKDLQIEGLKKLLEEAQRKASQGSQQIQGEVQELDFEESLRKSFPDDVIEPIGKGVHGADIRQVVRSQKGTVCGTILWESKRTKAWSDGWISKLKEDLIADKAHIPAIISDAVPEEAKTGIGLKEGVWIASPQLALALAMLLRKSLYDAAKQRAITDAKQSKSEQIYSYVTSHEFQHQVEAMIEVYNDMLDQIRRERVAYEKSWKQRESQVNRLLTGVAGMYGSMQEITGPAMPSIKSLELPSGEE